jgi:hypothetical protein
MVGMGRAPDKTYGIAAIRTCRAVTRAELWLVLTLQHSLPLGSKAGGVARERPGTLSGPEPSREGHCRTSEWWDTEAVTVERETRVLKPGSNSAPGGATPALRSRFAETFGCLRGYWPSDANRSLFAVVPCPNLVHCDGITRVPLASVTERRYRAPAFRPGAFRGASPIPQPARTREISVPWVSAHHAPCRGGDEPARTIPAAGRTTHVPVRLRADSNHDDEAVRPPALWCWLF